VSQDATIFHLSTTSFWVELYQISDYWTIMALNDYALLSRTSEKFMKTKPSHLISNYVSWILKKYQELHKELESREAYRIVSIDLCKVKINIFGTGKIFESTPQEIVADDQMLEGFSKKDIRRITYHACININKPKFQVIAQSFSEKLNKMIFKVKKQNSSKILEKTADEILSTNAMISHLTPNDAHRIGFVYGSESVLREKAEKKLLKE
jgi:hypothetical protein